MASVNIPTTSVDPNEQDTGKLVKQLLNAYIILTEELSFLLNNLDTRNLNEVDGDILVTGTVTAGKMNVEELSAISANLGHIIAGLIESVEIYGSYISTNRTGYPKAEMSSEQNLFGAYTDALRKIIIEAVNNNSGSPRILLESLGSSFSLYQQGSGSNIFTFNSELRLFSDKDIMLYPGVGYKVWSYFDQIKDLTTNQTLSNSLNSKAQSGVSTSLSGGHNHGIPDGTQFKDVNGVTHTFRVAANHSHAQN